MDKNRIYVPCYVNGNKEMRDISTIGGGGSSDIYETVASFTVGTMDQGVAQGFPVDWWYDAIQTAPFDINEDNVYYFNNTGKPCDGVLILPDVVKMVLFNCEVVDNEVRVIDESKGYAYVLIDDGTANTLGIASIYDISRETVKILKKVSSSNGGGLPEYHASDAGKVLTVNSDGELEWAMPT